MEIVTNLYAVVHGPKPTVDRTAKPIAGKGEPVIEAIVRTAKEAEQRASVMRASLFQDMMHKPEITDEEIDLQLAYRKTIRVIPLVARSEG